MKKTHSFSYILLLTLGLVTVDTLYAMEEGASTDPNGRSRKLYRKSLSLDERSSKKPSKRRGSTSDDEKYARITAKEVTENPPANMGIDTWVGWEKVARQARSRNRPPIPAAFEQAHVQPHTSGGDANPGGLIEQVARAAAEQRRIEYSEKRPNQLREERRELQKKWKEKKEEVEQPETSPSSSSHSAPVEEKPEEPVGQPAPVAQQQAQPDADTSYDFTTAVETAEPNPVSDATRADQPLKQQEPQIVPTSPSSLSTSSAVEKEVEQPETSLSTSNTTGESNTAVGVSAPVGNTTGYSSAEEEKPEEPVGQPAPEEFQQIQSGADTSYDLTAAVETAEPNPVIEEKEDQPIKRQEPQIVPTLSNKELGELFQQRLKEKQQQNKQKKSTPSSSSSSSSAPLEEEHDNEPVGQPAPEEFQQIQSGADTSYDLTAAYFTAAVETAEPNPLSDATETVQPQQDPLTEEQPTASSSSSAPVEKEVEQPETLSSPSSSSSSSAPEAQQQHVQPTAEAP
ncbi:MAG: hypothetical protein Q8Q25_03460, partial [bacterium]|nr:hypothetical protein [bacterium]